MKFHDCAAAVKVRRPTVMGSTPSRDFMSVENNNIRQFGIDPDAEVLRLGRLAPNERPREIEAQLRGYGVESGEDYPISHLFSYWPDSEGNFYTDSSLERKYLFSPFLDKKERDGLYVGSFERVKTSILENPNKVILWYSPPGPVDFTPGTTIMPYRYGALNIYYYDGSEVRGVVLKIDNEDVLSDFSDKLYKLSRISDVKDRITKTISCPVVLEDDFPVFLSKQRRDLLVYTQNLMGLFKVDYYLKQIIFEIGQVFNGYERPLPFDPRAIAQRFSETSVVTRNMISGAYVEVLSQIGQRYGISATQRFSLSGSCGGSKTSMFEMTNSLFGTDRDGFGVTGLDMHSSAFRKFFQGEGSDNVCKVCGKRGSDVICGYCKECAKNL